MRRVRRDATHVGVNQFCTSNIQLNGFRNRLAHHWHVHNLRISPSGLVKYSQSHDCASTGDCDCQRHLDDAHQGTFQRIHFVTLRRGLSDLLLLGRGDLSFFSHRLRFVADFSQPTVDLVLVREGKLFRHTGMFCLNPSVFLDQVKVVGLLVS